MAYIPKKARGIIDMSPIGSCDFKNIHELTYAIVSLVRQFSNDDPVRVQEAIGSMETAKAELYRKYIAPDVAQREFDHGGNE